MPVLTPAASRPDGEQPSPAGGSQLGAKGKNVDVWGSSGRPGGSPAGDAVPVEGTSDSVQPIPAPPVGSPLSSPAIVSLDVSPLQSGATTPSQLANAGRVVTGEALWRATEDSASRILGWQCYDTALTCTMLSSGLFIPTFVSFRASEQGVVDHKAVASYVSSVATIGSLVVFALLGGAAEYSNYKLRFLQWSTWIGSASFILMGVLPGGWVLSGILGVIVMLVSRACAVFYLAMLREVVRGNFDAGHQVAAGAALLANIGQVLFVAICAAVVGPPAFAGWESEWMEYRFPLMFSGLWWGGLGLFAFKRLSSIRGAPLPWGDTAAESWRQWGERAKTLLKSGLSKQWRAVKRLPRLPNLMKFLLAWLFLSDAGGSGAAVAALLVKDELGLSVLWVGVAAVVGFFGAAAGLYLFKTLILKGVLTMKTVILINLFTLSCAVLYVLVMTTIHELLVDAFVLGFSVSPAGTFRRSILAGMIPDGHQAVYMTLSEFSQMGTAWAGPLIIASVSMATGAESSAVGPFSAYRLVVVIVVLAEVALGIPFIYSVNIDEGCEQAEEYAKNVGGSRSSPGTASAMAASKFGSGIHSPALSSGATTPPLGIGLNAVATLAVEPETSVGNSEGGSYGVC